MVQTVRVESLRPAKHELKLPRWYYDLGRSAAGDLPHTHLGSTFWIGIKWARRATGDPLSTSVEIHRFKVLQLISTAANASSCLRKQAGP